VARSRIPSFNGLETELYRLSEGHGLSVVAIEKLNSAPNLLAALDVHPSRGVAPSDQAHAARTALIQFIAGCQVLNDDHRIALDFLLNLDPDIDAYKLKRAARRIELEQALRVGWRKRASCEKTAVRLLVEQLLGYATK
jgi:hypothetical protein